MTNNAEGSFGEDYYEPITNPLPTLPRPQNPQQVVNDYTEKTNPKLQEYNRRIVNKNTYDLMKILIYVLIGGIVIFGYLTLEGKFQSEISCPSAPACPNNVPCPLCPNFPNLSFPDCTNTCNFPNSININLSNSTG